MKPRSKAYLARITDIINKNVSNGIGTETWKVREYENHRFKVFCKCGFDFEIKDLKSSLVRKLHNPEIHGPLESHVFVDSNSKYFSTPEFENPIVCNNCNEKYHNYYEIKKLESFQRNIVAAGVKVFDKNKHPDLIKLSFFQKNLGVSNTTKKMFTKFFKKNIAFNKKTKTFFLIQNKSLKKIGLPILDAQTTRFFNDSGEIVSILFRSEIGKSTFHNTIKNFIDEISNFLDKRDGEKIKEILKSDFILEKSDNAYISSEYYKDLINIHISLIYYPPLFTILLSKGVHVYLDFIKMNGKPSLTDFRRAKPTSPTEMVERAIRYAAKRARKHSSDDFIKTISNERIKSFSIGKKMFKKIEFSKEKDKINFDTLYNSILLKNIEYKDLNGLLLESNEEQIKAFNMIHNNMVKCDLRTMKHIFKLSNTVLVKENKQKIKEEKFQMAWLVDNNPFQNNVVQNNVDKSQYYYINLNVYNDIIRMYSLLEINPNQIFQFKNWKDIIDEHDDLILRMKNLNLEEYNKKIKSFIDLYLSLDMTIDSVKFETLKTAMNLEKEGQEMSHCVASYVGSVAEGRCIIIKVTDEETGDRATIELRLNSDERLLKYYCGQLKAKHNQKATKKIIEKTLVYLHKIKADANDCFDLLYEKPLINDMGEPFVDFNDIDILF